MQYKVNKGQEKRTVLLITEKKWRCGTAENRDMEELLVKLPVFTSFGTCLHWSGTVICMCLPVLCYFTCVWKFSWSQQACPCMRWDRSVDLWPASQTCCRSCVNTLLLHYFSDDFAVNLRTLHTENDLNLRTIRMGLWLCYQAWLPKHHLIPWRLP